MSSRSEVWNNWSVEQKVSHLLSNRRTCLNQLRRSVHTSRNTRGLEREIEHCEMQLQELGFDKNGAALSKAESAQ
jgi:hypothetical protein